jgi:hypothetical protein
LVVFGPENTKFFQASAMAQVQIVFLVFGVKNVKKAAFSARKITVNLF